MEKINKYHELETKPIIGASGGAAMGGIFGASGVLIGGIVGFLVALGIVLYFYFYKKM
jgi:hypothetical protein